MSTLQARKAVLLAKTETPPGQDSSPIGSTDAVLTSDLTITPIVSNLVDRNLDRPTLGASPQIHVGVHASCSFNVEIAGSGTKETPPAYGSLLGACGMAATVGASDVQYDLVSSNWKSVSMHMFFDGQKHVMLMSRGTFDINLSTGGVPVFSFNFLGLLVDPASAPDPTVDFSNYKTPLPVNSVNTPTFSLDSYAANMETLIITLGNQVVYRDVVGSQSIQIVDRATTGRVGIEAPALSTKNYFTTVRQETIGALQVIHGTAEGNIVQFDAPRVQLLSPRYGDSDGIRTLEMDLSIIPSDAGNDELKITTK